MSAKLKSDRSPSHRSMDREAQREQSFLLRTCLYVRDFCKVNGVIARDRDTARQYQARVTGEFTFQFEERHGPARGCTIRVWFHPGRPYDPRTNPVLERWWYASPERGHTMGPLASGSLWRERMEDLMDGTAPLLEPPAAPESTPEPTKTAKASVRLLDARVKVHHHPTLPELIEGLQLTQGMRLKKGDLVARDNGWQEISPHLVGLRVDLDSPTPSYFVRPICESARQYRDPDPVPVGP